MNVDYRLRTTVFEVMNMAWMRLDENTFTFEAWLRLGWNLRVSFYEDVEEVLGRLWLSSYEGQVFIRLGLFSSAEEFKSGLHAVLAEAVHRDLSAPNADDVLPSVSDGWLDTALHGASASIRV